jgi:hypothetical protein
MKKILLIILLIYSMKGYSQQGIGFTESQLRNTYDDYPLQLNYDVGGGKYYLINSPDYKLLFFFTIYHERYICTASILYPKSVPIIGSLIEAYNECMTVIEKDSSWKKLHPDYIEAIKFMNYEGEMCFLASIMN